MMETSQAYAWVYQTLAGSPELAAIVGARIYRDVAPVTAQLPLVVFSLVGSGRDVMTNGAERILTELLVQVKIIAEAGQYVTASIAADIVSGLLHRGSGTDVVACVREFAIDYLENDTGRLIAHVGGQFRLWIEAQ